jgi:hypothetical protein
MNIIRKLYIIGLIIAVGGTIYLLNRPRPINVENRYSTSDVGIIMEGETGDLDSGVIGYEKHIENSFLALYVDDDTSQFAVKDKRNDYTWYSSNNKSDPLIKSASIRNLQKSTLQITYLQSDGTVATMNNYEYSMRYKRDFEDSFRIDYGDDGIDITYTLSDREPKGYWFPAYISRERFNELVQVPVQLGGSAMDLRNLLDYYGPLEDDPDTYVIRQLVKDEDTNEFDMTELSGAQVETLFKLFYEIGYYGNKTDDDGEFIEEYTLDDVSADNAQYGIVINFNQPEFVVPMEVRLEDDNLSVKINYFAIEERNGFEIVSIKVLPYFGAIRNDTDGYMVIPEGSGGLIHLNNGKTASKSYSSFIYGADNTKIEEEITARDIGSHMPIFGIKSPNNAMLGIIESGAAHSKVTADVSEKYDSYNKIYNEFLFKQSGSYQLAENTVQLWMESDYTYSPEVSYYFFAEEDANYTEMAHLYGSYLAQKYRWEELPMKAYSLYLDILGSYDYDSFFLWFPTNKNDSLTTYDQAITMIEELQQAGVDSQVIRYVGWFNNGIDHQVPNKIDFDRSVGSKRDWRAFNTFLEEQGYPVFYDVDFTKVYDSSLFYTSKNYSRVIGGNVSKLYPVTAGTLIPDRTKDPYYLSNLSAIDRNTTRFLKDATRLDLPGISFRNLGDMLYSDYKNNAEFSREFTSIYYQDIMAKFAGMDILVEGGNEYSLSLASYITNMEARTSTLIVVDESIPFYQLALAPYKNISLPSFNHRSVFEPQEYVLKALETGSSPKAVLSYDNTTELMYTDFNEYFSVMYANNKDDIIALMTTFNAYQLEGAYLQAHEIIDDGVVLVTYSDGRQFLVNYTELPVTYQTIEVGPLSYNEIEVD